jgi:hypothetical protein
VISIIIIYIRTVKIETFQNDQEEIGFIVTRCVKKPQHNTLYKECYEAIRKYHPELKIIFIDDNSDKEILDDYPMTNVEIISSEYPAAGEYLPYWYLLQRKMFKKAIFLQDSVILNGRISYEGVDDYMYLYENPPMQLNDTLNLLNITKDSENIIKYYNHNEWKGCWGSMMIITSEFITALEEKVGISVWKDVIKTRVQRIALESAIGIACMYTKRDKEKYSLFGKWEDSKTYKDPGNENHTIEMYLTDKTLITDPLIKIWNGR